MIRFFVYSLLALIAGAVLSVLLGDDPGYLLISFAGYSIETSVVVAVCILLIVIVIIYGLNLFLGNLLRLFRLGGLQIFNSKRRARTSTEKGLLLLGEGKSREAYKLLLQSAGNVESPLVNYLAASLAAFQDDDRKSWLYCLQQAEKICDRSTSIESIKAFYEMKSGNVEQSLAMLLELHKLQPGNRSFLRMLKNIYIALEDWEQLLLLLPDLKQHAVVDDDDIHELYLRAAQSRMEQIKVDQGSAPLIQCWELLPKNYRHEEHLLAVYLEKLAAVGDDDAVQKQVARFIKRSWSDRLILLIGYLDTANPGEFILWLEKYIKDRPRNAGLALTLGRLCLRNKQWVKGREYFEQALRFSQNTELTAEISAELGRLLESLGEHERSVACYQNALGMLAKKLPDLPMPL